MIGIFDSGSGGLSVLSALRAIAPGADIIYFGDLKNAPYGNKSREELGALTALGIKTLRGAGATEIVSACNSVSVTIALPLFDLLGVPRESIIEMVGPSVASLRGSGARVLVVATQATVESGAYQHAFALAGMSAQALAIPELVGRIESGGSERDMVPLIRNALASVPRDSFDTLFLGCTHFPLVRVAFEYALSELGISATLFDPAEPVARAAHERFDTRGKGATRFLLSRESAQFRTFATGLGLLPDAAAVEIISP